MFSVNSRRKRLMYLSWAKLIFAWLCIYYFYYLVFFWGPADLIKEDVFREYLYSYKAHIEIILVSIFYGILFGIINTLIENSNIHSFPFGQIIIIKSILYILAFILVSFLIFLIFNMLDIFPYHLIESIAPYTGYRMITSFIIYSVAAIILINIVIQINKIFGPGEMQKIILGKYHQPKEENRVFLFIDMKGSTEIAEKLGNNNYSKLIRECFNDLSEFIIEYQASIYQHVGDEIILTWEKKKAFNKFNALNAFFRFQDKLNKKRNKYLRKYTVAPEFKAAIHMGYVTVTETGDLKREIAFHGDVINTAARLEKQCNVFNESMLISEKIMDNLQGLNGFLFIEHGLVELKGKSKSLKVYGVREKN